MQPMSSDEAKGLLKSLFDFQFTTLITTRVIRFVYALIVILLTVGAAIFFILSLASGSAAGVLGAFIFLPLSYLIYLILTRIWMEILIVIFRIGDDIHAIRQAGGLGRGPTHPA